jgi:uncharacterized phage-associated protein
MTHDWFDARKAAQVVAFFAGKAGNRINVLKLVKLVYLGDRENMRRHGYPVTNDNFVSMPHGPVNSLTYSHMNGAGQGVPGWEEFVRPLSNYEIGAQRTFTIDELDELSEAEVETLDAVWTEFGGMHHYTIRDWTHGNCPEWEDPNGSSNPIPHSRVYKYLGFNDAEEREAEIWHEREVDEIFASMRA